MPQPHRTLLPAQRRLINKSKINRWQRRRIQKAGCEQTPYARLKQIYDGEECCAEILKSDDQAALTHEFERRLGY